LNAVDNTVTAVHMETGRKNGSVCGVVALIEPSADEVGAANFRAVLEPVGPPAMEKILVLSSIRQRK
jgi:hypothetical protein